MRKNILRFGFFISIIAFLLSCGGSNGIHDKEIFSNFRVGDNGELIADLNSCKKYDRLSFLDQIFHDIYYFANKTPNISIDNFLGDDRDYLEEIKYKKDRFSFILDKSNYNDFFQNSTTVDYGYLNLYLDQNRSIIYFVYPNSPADKAGIKRSDIIIGTKFLDDNKTTTFKILTDNSTIKDINLTKEKFVKQELTNSKILDLDDKKIGYFNLNSFVGKNIERNLDKLFLEFKKENIDELVVDLRYNMGGNIDVAAHLGTLIAGEKSFSHIFQHHNFNKKYSSSNSNSYFDSKNSNALNLQRVFILVTYSSASASESLISALRASDIGVDVVLIGKRTYGKPYSMYAIKYCDKVLFPVLMKNFNSDYSQNYDDGFEPTCKVDDDLSHNFGDINESLLNEAIYYIKNGSCKDR